MPQSSHIFLTHTDDASVNFTYMGCPYSYEYDANKGSFVTMSDKTVADYEMDLMYKSMLCMAIGITENDDGDDEDFYTAYMTKVLQKTMETARVTLSLDFPESLNGESRDGINYSKDSYVHYYWYYDTDKCPGEYIDIYAYSRLPVITVDIIIEDTGLMDMVHQDETDNIWVHSSEANSKGLYKANNVNSKFYHKWEGWYTPEGKMSDSLDMALFYYELPDEDWEDLFPDLQFPGNTAKKLSDAEIERIMEQIGVSGARAELVETLLRGVGRYNYHYGGGHPVPADRVGSPGDPSSWYSGGLDCSGFMSYMMYLGGVDSVYSARGACGFLSSYGGHSSFNGDFTSLEPGTILVKNTSAGGSTTSSNHVVCYIGEFQWNGDVEPRPYCVECTTANDWDGTPISGSMLSTKNRMKTIKGYGFKIDPF